MKQPAALSTLLVLVGVLKAYIKHPLGFILASKTGFGRFKKSINLDLPAEFINTTGFIAWLYIRLTKRVGKSQAFEIIRVALLTSGLAVQQVHFRNVEAERTFDNLKIYQKKANREGSTRLNSMEVIEENDHLYHFRVTRCVFHEFFSYLQVPELTSIMCSVDNAIFNTYLPEVLTFHRKGIGNTLYSGKKYCEFVIENHSS